MLMAHGIHVYIKVKGSRNFNLEQGFIEYEQQLYKLNTTDCTTINFESSEKFNIYEISIISWMDEM